MDGGYTPDPIDEYLAIAEQVRIILNPKEAKYFLLEECPDVAALDFETTGLHPKTGAVVRLTCIYHPDCGAVILDHFFCGAFEELVFYMLDIEWAVYNAKFESTWFDWYDKEENALITDIDFLAKAKLGGHHTSLARMAKRDLGITLDKGLQMSDWSQTSLTKEQYVYGALDSVLTWAMYSYWQDEISDEQAEASNVFQDVVRPTMECEQTGLYLDVELHMKNIKMWKMKQENVRKALRRIVPESALKSLTSDKQMSDFLKSQLDNASLAAWPKTEKKEQLKCSRDVLAPMAAKAPYPFSRFLNCYWLYRFYAKYLSTYGEGLVFKQHADGKVTSRFNIAQAATGRFSSSSSNLQNIPRKPYIRRAFTVDPTKNELMVLADYKGIEIRTLAELSDDEKLRNDAIYGDVHSASAATIFHIDEDLFLEVVENKKDKNYARFKEMRSKAKGFTFQLLYGAGDEALSLVLKCSVAEASQAVIKWGTRYSRAYNYRNVIFEELGRTGFIPIVTGRTVYVRKPDRSVPVAANYGVQGAAGDVICRAMHHVRELNRLHQTGARLAATVHDELLEYCPVPTAEQAEKDLIKGMERGWLDIFPGSNTDNLVDSAIGLDWSAKP